MLRLLPPLDRTLALLLADVDDRALPRALGPLQRECELGSTSGVNAASSSMLSSLPRDEREEGVEYADILLACESTLQSDKGEKQRGTVACEVRQLSLSHSQSPLQLHHCPSHAVAYLFALLLAVCGV